eukprot:CAMPEP_0197027940 /NCGR_PEP_ID=MMETSP1384-20130603/7789_1 /TAXON_ID=29189 /ORGANISM="Ammonia sp." /LENGTH=822 /DNA_ID=CAMNT_0042456869 /DNA_START=23 /DNA_END=2491 /DNA_ORIENTATION=+
MSTTNQSCSLQILGSDSEQQHLLQYCATEEEWTKYLTGSGLLEAKNANSATPGNAPQHRLNATPGGPLDVGSSNEHKENAQKYAIISIMGPQSSGKSTILNKLFGTKFEVMDHTKGRRQVTTGIWIGSCPRARDLMILDLEGTDSAERKQNRSNFERQTSLMALTLSEILIINMWAADIGRATGMNVDTLRAILEANMRLFAPKSKTLLLFLIREQSPDETVFGVTPAAQLTAHIEKVLNSIWSEIEKPESFVGKQITDLFDIDFFFMPPLVYFRDLFHQRVNELYGRFTDASNSKYYFSTSYHFSKCVPPEGLYTWTKQIFDAITQDESLNIPDQQKLLSAYRCEHALNESYAVFTQKTEMISRSVQEKYVDGFGQKLDAIIAECVQIYKATANKYDKEEAAEKYASLVDKIETQIQYLFNFQFNHLVDKVMELYQFEMRQSLPNGMCVDNLDGAVQSVGEKIRKFFSSKISECMINTENEKFLNKDMYWQETQKRLRDSTKTIQMEQWQLLCKENENLADEHLLTPISKLLRNPNKTMWPQMSSLRIHYHGDILHKQVLRKLQHLMYDEIKMAEKEKALRDSSDTLIVNRCKKWCSRMDGVLQDRFDRLFNKNPDTGIPRTWDETVKLDDIFTSAKNECLEILSLSQHIVLSDNSELKLQAIKLKLLSADTIEDIRQDFLRWADGQYVRAQDYIRRSNMLGGGILPTHPVTWLLFLFFAKDELWTMLTNPLYLILFIFGAAILIIGYQAHTYGFDVQTIVMNIVSRAINMCVSKLQEFQQAQINIQQAHKSRSGMPARPLNPMYDDDTGSGVDIDYGAEQ